MTHPRNIVRSWLVVVFTLGVGCVGGPHPLPPDQGGVPAMGAAGSRGEADAGSSTGGFGGTGGAAGQGAAGGVGEGAADGGVLDCGAGATDAGVDAMCFDDDAGALGD